MVLLRKVECTRKCNSSVTERLVPECMFSTFSTQYIKDEGICCMREDKHTLWHLMTLDIVEDVSVDVTNQ